MSDDEQFQLTRRSLRGHLDQSKVTRLTRSPSGGGYLNPIYNGRLNQCPGVKTYSLAEGPENRLLINVHWGATVFNITGGFPY